MIAGEVLYALGHHVSQAGFLREVDDLRGCQVGQHRGQIKRSAAAPLKRQFVVVDLHVVQLNRTHQRRMAERYAALLPSVAQHQRVGVQRVANQLHGQQIRVDSADVIGLYGGANGGVAIGGRELPIRVAHEGRGRRAVGVQRHIGAAHAHDGHGRLVGADDGVAANHQVGLGRADFGGRDRLHPIGNLNVAPRTAAFLR